MRLEIVSHRLHAARIIVISLFCILAGFGLTDHAVAQTDPEISWHEVYPGDTWSALAWQYGVAENQLWSLNQLLNSQRQPAIGSDVLVAGLEESSQFRGRLVQPTGRGLLEISSRHNEDPWQIALLNHLASPYSAPLGRTLFVPDGVSLPRELPVGFESLVLSNSPILPGQAIAFRASLSQPITVTANLGGSDFILPQTSDTAAGIIGTGAFFQPGVYDFEISIEGHPNWIQPTLFQPGEWSYEQITLTGSAAEIDQESIRQEWERLSSIWSQVTPEFMWKDSFRLPIDDFLEFRLEQGEIGFLSRPGRHQEHLRRDQYVLVLILARATAQHPNFAVGINRQNHAVEPDSDAGMPANVLLQPGGNVDSTRPSITGVDASKEAMGLQNQFATQPVLVVHYQHWHPQRA